ncbi:MAG TPA: MFS transporter, partial [bacterium]|nr:MFS transporter [bacterium]
GTLALGDALRNARALRFIAAYAAHNWELFGMRAWMPAFLAAMWVGRGLPVEAAAARGAAFGSLVLFASALSNAAGGWLSDHVGRRRTIVTFLTASTVCSFTIGWTLPLGTAVVVGVALFYGLFVTADSSTLSTAVAESAAPHALGSTLAVQSALGFLVTAVASPLFGIVLDATASGWGWAFASLGIVALAGALVAAKA